MPLSVLERAQREQQGIRSVGAADGVLDLREAGDAALELRDGIAEDERLLIHDVHHRGNDFIADGGVLRLEIEKRNGHDGLVQMLTRSGRGTSRPVFADS